MSKYFKVPATTRVIRESNRTVHVPTFTMVYERSLNNVLGFSTRAPWKIEGRHHALRQMMYGGTVITDDQNLFHMLGRAERHELLGDRRIFVSEEYARRYDSMAVKEEQIVDSVVNAVAKAIATEYPPVWFIGSEKLLEQAEYFVDHVIETVIMDNTVGQSGNPLYKYEGSKEILEFDRSNTALLPDGCSAVVEHRLYKVKQKQQLATL